MKKLISIIVVALALVGCDHTPSVTLPSAPTRTYFNVVDGYGNKPIVYCVTVIDGCEYVNYAIHGFAHKGNCTNQIHIYNK